MNRYLYKIFGDEYLLMIEGRKIFGLEGSTTTMGKYHGETFSMVSFFSGFVSSSQGELYTYALQASTLKLIIYMQCDNRQINGLILN